MENHPFCLDWRKLSYLLDERYHGLQVIKIIYVVKTRNGCLGMTFVDIDCQGNTFVKTKESFLNVCVLS